MTANARPEDTDLRLERVTFGQGSFGGRCQACGADNWAGDIVHRPGCMEVWKQMRKLRGLAS